MAVTTDGRPVRSRHGLTFVPRAELASAAPGLDRLVVPGTDAARRAVADGLVLPEGLAPVYLHGQPGFAFDAALATSPAPGMWPPPAGWPRPCSTRPRAHRCLVRPGPGP